MMDRNYPAAPGFADPLAPAAAAAPPSAAWAYERGASSLKPSLTYGGGHPPHSETDLLHRQTFAASHQLPGYATTHHPTGLTGIFDTSIHSAGNNTKETSVMNFLSAIESLTVQAASSGTTLVPQFRAPAWQTGMHSSTPTELFVTGALPASGTFPPTSALSAYQHPNSFSSRSFVTTPSLTLQDATFSATSNGLLTAHDPLLQIKTSQGTVPTALTFERLGSSVLSTSVPPQSSTYRSAQESAPHLLQPQFTLLPSTLGGAQQVSQAYSTSVFTGSTASIDRAFQRECSVIKHHQRPSNTQPVQAQLTSSQHSLHSYLSNTSGVNFQDTSRQSALSCSPVGDATQVSNGGPQQKTSHSQVSVELAQSYTSAIPSPGFPPASTAKAKNCSTKQPPRSTKTPKPQNVAPPVQTQSYFKTAQNQSSVITGQAQIYSTAQLPTLLSVSQSQNYVSTPSQNVPSVSLSQDFSSGKVEKLPSIYKTLTFSAQSQAITSDTQTLSYSSEQQVLTSVPNENYSGQTRDLSSVSQSQSYSSSHSQGLSPVSQSQVNYSSQSQVLSAVSPSESYTSGQPLTLTSPSLPFSSSPRIQNLSVSSPSQNYISLQTSQNSQPQESSSPQSQKFLPAVQSPPFASPAHSQTLQNNRSSSDTKSYVKRKSDSNLYASSKDDDELSMQDLQALQQQASLESSTQRLTDDEISAQDTAYRVSKADDRYSQSVIRSNSRLEDQVVGLTLQGSKKDERMINSVAQLSQQIGHITNVVSHDIKKAADLMQAAQVNASAKELNQQHVLLHKVHENKTQEQQSQVVSTSQHIQAHALRHSNQLCLPSAQVLLDSACDLQILQQSILQSGLGQAKASPQVQRIQSPQQVAHPFLQIDGHIIQSNGGHSQQQLHPQNSEVMKMDISESSKPLQQHLTTKDHFTQPNQHDSKNQFVSLGSICFPESMLLTDERNILSNVDDILAATAAACGVTPSEFAKSTSNEEEIQSVENGENSKSQFQSIDVRHVSTGFSSSPTVVGKPQSLHNISLNGGQITLNLTAMSAIQPKNVNLDQQHIETSDQNVPSRMTSPTLGPSQQEQEQSSSTAKKQSSINHESEEDNDIPVEGALTTRDPEFVSSGRSLSEESAASDNDFNMGGHDGSVAGNQAKGPLQSIPVPHQGDGIVNKTEEENHDLTQDSLQKKKNKGKGQIKNAVEDDNVNQKQLKKSGQCKRQNSRGTDICLTYSSPISECCYDTYQHQEKMRQKIKEVEEKQPEVKTGFIGSFLDFLKSGPRQQFSAPAVRMPNRTRRPVTQIVRAPCPHPPSKPQPAAAPVSVEVGSESPTKKADEELKKNLETLPTFSSDEDDSVGGNHDLQKSISTALSALDDNSDKKNKSETEKLAATSAVTTSTSTTTTTTATTTAAVKQESPHTTAPVVNVQNMQEKTSSTEALKVAGQDGVTSDQLAKIQASVAIEGYIDEENTDSGGEGMYRERDEFVVKIEDIDALKVSLQMGKEPPAIWKVQKALLQKFVPEVRDGQRQFAATNSYLGYFGDAKTKYKRVYVKFIENANKKEYVRVCSKKPQNRPVQSARTIHCKPSGGSNKAPDPPAPKPTTTKVSSSVKPKAKQPKLKAEPPPKKRKKWKEEFSSSQSDSSPEAQSDDDELVPPAPFVTRFLNTRAMKETFKSYMELLVSIALDPDTMQALEKSNDELLLPHMRKIDGMLNDNRKRLLPKLHLEHTLKNALENFPELTVITRDSKSKSGGAAISKIKMNGKAYNKKTLRASKSTTKLAQEFTVDPEKIQLYSLYHSLHHYKYHIYLTCKEEISSVQKKSADLGQEEIVQLCMKNIKWVEDLFEKFGELLNRVQQKCL